MFKAVGQAQATTQFFLFGKSHCTKTGYISHKAEYAVPDEILDSPRNLKDKIYMITGANTGIGKEIASYLAKNNATVYMLCRNLEKSNEIKDVIIKETSNQNVYMIQCDVSLRCDVDRAWNDFITHQKKTFNTSKLDSLICNAGALLNDKTFTTENVEVTLAAHLLYGTYFLGKLALPMLEATESSRLLVVSSGGMYTTKFPDWEVAASTSCAIADNSKYSGNLAYAYAKRGQVLLCEEWAKQHPKVKIVTCHPGWTLTEGLDKAYSEKKSYLEPLRNLWEGAEGITWLAITDRNNIETGAFYLDRKPQRKHIAGAFFTEGSFTKNTPAEISSMMMNLERWCKPNSIWIPSQDRLNAKIATRNKGSVVAMSKTLDVNPRFMGRWHVLAVVPTPFEVNTFDCYENYEYDNERKLIKVLFQYKNMNDDDNNVKETNMHAVIHNPPINSEWRLSIKVLFYLPLNLQYLTLHVSNDYSYTMVGVPDRSYLWIMTRKKPTARINRTKKVNLSATDVEEMSLEEEEKIMNESVIIAEKLGYDVSKLQMSPYSY